MQITGERFPRLSRTTEYGKFYVSCCSFLITILLYQIINHRETLIYLTYSLSGYDFLTRPLNPEISSIDVL
jgi:hypothetical protein